MTTKTNILAFDIGITKLRHYDRTTLVSNTIHTVCAAFSKSDNNIKSEALNTFSLFKNLLSVEIYYNRIKRMNTEYT
jgi:hypothetical protein